MSIVTLQKCRPGEKFDLHTLRHAFASHAIDGDADVLVLKTILGHASIKTTELYLHPSIITLRKAVADHVSTDILSELKIVTNIIVFL